MRITIETDGTERVSTATTASAGDTTLGTAVNGGAAPGGTSVGSSTESGTFTPLQGRTADYDGGPPPDALRRAIEEAGGMSQASAFDTDRDGGSIN
jgi:hypothetical protein